MQHGEAVYLANLGAVGINKHAAAQYLFLHGFADAADSAQCFFGRLFDVICLDNVMTALAGEVVGLSDQIAQAAYLCRKPF